MDGNAASIIQFIRVGGLVTGLIIIAVAWFVARLLSRTIDNLGRRFADRRLQLQQAGTFLRFFIYIGAFVAALLTSFQLSSELLLTLGGTIAVTVGFAVKDLAASVLAGLTILVDKPFQVGDRVTFGGYYGEISAIGLRSVRLVTLDDNLVTIPNNKFLTEAVSCGNAGALDMLVQSDFYIGVDQDVTRARQVVIDAITTSRYAYLGKPWAVLVNQVVHQGYFAVRLRAKVYVLDIQYEKALETDVTLHVLEGFRQGGIGVPSIIERHGSLAGEAMA